MPVRRFRDVSEVPEPWQDRGPALIRAIRNVWAFAARTVPQQFPPGVYRHRSIEDAGRQRERWEQASFERFQEARRGRR